jgi:hypothetical protein
MAYLFITVVIQVMNRKTAAKFSWHLQGREFRLVFDFADFKM